VLAGSAVTYLAILQVPFGWLVGLFILAGECVALVRLRPLQLPLFSLIATLLVMCLVPLTVVGGTWRCQVYTNNLANDTQKPILADLEHDRQDLESAVEDLAKNSALQTVAGSNERTSWATAATQDSRLQLLVATDQNDVIVTTGSNQRGWAGPLSGYASWSDSLTKDGKLSGFAKLANGSTYLIATHSIVNKDSATPGHLVIGRQVTAEYLQSLNGVSSVDALGIAD
jgi:hypothetical protein